MRVEPSCTASGSRQQPARPLHAGQAGAGLVVGTGLPRALGAVIGLKAQAVHRVIPQPCAQAFAQLLPGQGLLRAIVEQFLKLRNEARQVFGAQAKTAHRRLDLHLLQPPARQFEEHRRVALGAEQPDLDQRVRQPGVFQVQVEALHAAVAPAEKRRQVTGQAAQRKQQRLMGLHIEIEFDAHIETVRRQIERQRPAGAPRARCPGA